MLFTNLVPAVFTALHFPWTPNAGCDQLRNISVLSEAEVKASPFARSVFHSQTSPCSIGVVCGNPNATPQSYGPFDSPFNNCEPNECFIESHGQVSAYAQTNVTPAAQWPDGSNNPAGRIVDLALRQVKWPHTSYMHHVSSATTERGDIASHCIGQGTSGWAQYTPSFTCATGVLDQCGSGSARSDVEYDGTPVMICVPSITRSFEPNTLQFSGSFKSTSPGAAKKLRHNPSVSGAARSTAPTGLLIPVIVGPLVTLLLLF